MFGRRGIRFGTSVPTRSTRSLSDSVGQDGRARGAAVF